MALARRVSANTRRFEADPAEKEMSLAAADVLRELVALSCRLGEPSRDCVILGEGNTSAAIDDDWCYVKASGVSLCGITERGFVKVNRKRVLELLAAGTRSDEQVKQALMAAAADPAGPRPSVETTFHVYLLGLPGVRFVGHTHPIAVNAILCARNSREIVSGRIFPDEIVCLGRAPVYVPYTDPGVTLALAIKQGVERFREEEGEGPKAILMENHGLVALGGTPQEVETITAMWVKTAQVLAGTFLFGGPRYLAAKHVDRIHTRPDEAYRKRALTGQDKASQ